MHEREHCCAHTASKAQGGWPYRGTVEHRTGNVLIAMHGSVMGTPRSATARVMFHPHLTPRAELPRRIPTAERVSCV